MGCPMGKKSAKQEATTEYPFEPIYRPWSWALSSFSNILLFAILFAAIYSAYRRNKSKKRREVGYRTVESKKAEALKFDGKIKAVVTGGSGNLGKEIVRYLIEEENYLIYSLDLFIPDEDCRNDDVYSYIQADILDKDSLRLALKDAEVVFHAAGIIPLFVGYSDQDFLDINATGTENVVSVCKEVGVKRLIYTSSIATMLSSDPSQVVENLNESTPYPKQNRDAYGTSKVIAEKCVLGANGDELLTCSLRPYRIVDAKVIAIENTRYVDDGSRYNQLIPLDTTAKVHVLAEKKLQSKGKASAIAGKAFILTFDDAYTHKEISEFVARERDGKEAGSVPYWFMKLMANLDSLLYSVTGKVLVSVMLRTDTILYFSKSHTFSGALGRKEIGWEDKRSWKDVVRQLIKEGEESKKDN